MLHRIREVMNSGTTPFNGIIEVDKAYFSGKEGNKHTVNKFKSEKTAVIGLVNRDTKNKLRQLQFQMQIKKIYYQRLVAMLKMGSTIVTDTYHA